MSEIKVNSIKGVGASTAAITVNNSDGTCTANITNNLSNRNLIINGAMQVAQRGTSTTTTGGFCVDRFQCFHGGTDEAPTFEQADVSAGTTPYTLGFRKCLKITNGNQTNNAGAADYVWIQSKHESQNISNSGWNYVSSSSYITLSFWVKSSVAQDFKGFLKSENGTNQSYPFATGVLTADTWTKVTKTISGNSNLTFNNDNLIGLNINFLPFFGTSYTNNSATENAWQTYAATARCKDSTATWYETNDATFEITGVQLEVGSVATDFEHRSFGQELALCQRYCYVLIRHDGVMTGAQSLGGTGSFYSTDGVYMSMNFPVTMRATPTFSCVNKTNALRFPSAGSSRHLPTLSMTHAHSNACTLYGNTTTTTTAGNAANSIFDASNTTEGDGIFFFAEL